jgi:predicted methyltransferase
MNIQMAGRFIGVAAGAILFSVSIASASGGGMMSAADETKLEKVLASGHRGENNAGRDIYRHPLEVLKFFRLRSDMTVMEIWPAGGWWTEVLAPFLSENGRYFAAHFPQEGGPAYFSRSLNSFKEKLSNDPQNYEKVEVTALNPDTGETTPAEPGSIDLALTFRNVHNWMSQDSTSAMITAIHTSLKPGGYLGVVEHRASADAPQDPKAKSGYVREDYAIDVIEKAGFKLVAKSDINANPKDTKDYSGGVWTLPPSFGAGDKERSKYAAIGESDRFTLLFQKSED